MNIILKILIIASTIVGITIIKAEEKIISYQDQIDMTEAKINSSTEEDLIEFINQIFANNSIYTKQHGYEYFQTFANKQTPQATVVICSDSRVQTSVFDGNRSVNNFFIIRNIGNQIETAKGSVEFGIRNLQTPLLLIIGHSGCGAIDAALKDFSNESPAIQKELNSLKLPRKDLISATKFNVHQQVRESIKMFDDLIKEQKLVVLGLIYDFRDDFKHGYGSLILVNINGETNPSKIKRSKYLKTTEGIPIGVGE